MIILLARKLMYKKITDILFFSLFQIFTSGKTNKLIGIWYADHYTDMVLVRIYGNNTELLVNRKNEIKNIRVRVKIKN